MRPAVFNDRIQVLLNRPHRPTTTPQQTFLKHRAYHDLR
jgi:hypothetical protein